MWKLYVVDCETTALCRKPWTVSVRNRLDRGICAFVAFLLVANAAWRPLRLSVTLVCITIVIVGYFNRAPPAARLYSVPGFSGANAIHVYPGIPPQWLRRSSSPDNGQGVFDEVC